MAAAGSGRRGERGFTLVEMVVTVGLLLVIGGSAYASLAQRPAQAHATAVGLRAFVEEARSLAAVTGAAATGGNSGATIGFTRDGDTYVATLYAYRPIAGTTAPVAQPNTPPFRTRTAIALNLAGRDIEPPFAIFFSVSGHAGAQAGFSVDRSPPPAVEPACSLSTGIVLSFDDTHQTQLHAISCEMARLDVDDAADSTLPATSPRRTF